MNSFTSSKCETRGLEHSFTKKKIKGKVAGKHSITINSTRTAAQQKKNVLNKTRDRNWFPDARFTLYSVCERTKASLLVMLASPEAHLAYVHSLMVLAEEQGWPELPLASC